LDDDVRGLFDPLVVITAISEDAPDERIQRAGGAKKRSAAVATLDARGMRFEKERTPICIHRA